MAADWLMVGLGNPGRGYADTRHNVGFEVAAILAKRFELGRARKRFSGLVYSGRYSAGVQVAILLPQTFMNDAGRSVGPARGSTGVALERVVVIHDDIDLGFGEVRTRLGGGLAGHNGLKSVRAALGSADFYRVRVGVGRPPSTDPEVVASFVLSRFSEEPTAVRALVESAADAAERLIAGDASGV